MTFRGLGWVSPPARTPERVAAAAAHLNASVGAELPDSFCLSRPLWILDQGTTEACTAHMGVGMVYELTGAKCSPWVPWWAARLYDTPGQLLNVGCSTDGFLYALSQDGACDWDELPTLGVSDTPTVICRIDAQRHKLDVVPIYATGNDAEQALRTALVGGYPGALVVNVDAGYDHPAPDGTVGPEDGPSRGQHAVRVRGYRTDATGVRWYLSPGSWGTGYGLGGEVWLHQDRVRFAPFLGFGRTD